MKDQVTEPTSVPTVPQTTASPTVHSVELPELPEPTIMGAWGDKYPSNYSADQMRDYARQAIAASQGAKHNG